MRSAGRESLRNGPEMNLAMHCAEVISHYCCTCHISASAWLSLSFFRVHAVEVKMIVFPRTLSAFHVAMRAPPEMHLYNDMSIGSICRVRGIWCQYGVLQISAQCNAQSIGSGREPGSGCKTNERWGDEMVIIHSLRAIQLAFEHVLFRTYPTVGFVFLSCRGRWYEGTFVILGPSRWDRSRSCSSKRSRCMTYRCRLSDLLIRLWDTLSIPLKSWQWDKLEFRSVFWFRRYVGVIVQLITMYLRWRN